MTKDSICYCNVSNFICTNYGLYSNSLGSFICVQVLILQNEWLELECTELKFTKEEMSSPCDINIIIKEKGYLISKIIMTGSHQEQSFVLQMIIVIGWMTKYCPFSTAKKEYTPVLTL